MASGGQWLGIGWAPWRGGGRGGTSPSSNAPLFRPGPHSTGRAGSGCPWAGPGALGTARPPTSHGGSSGVLGPGAAGQHLQHEGDQDHQGPTVLAVLLQLLKEVGPLLFGAEVRDMTCGVRRAPGVLSPRLILGPQAVPAQTPPCDIPSRCCFFTGPWTVTRSSLRMLRRVAAFCRPLRPVLLLVSFPRSRSPVVGVMGLC